MPAGTGIPHDQNKSANYQPEKYKHGYPQCSCRFDNPHNVKQHLREAHNEGSMSVCSYCEKEFARPWSLFRHIKSIHGIDVHPGASATKKQKRKQIGREGPILVRPEEKKGFKIKVLADEPAKVEFEAMPGAEQDFDGSPMLEFGEEGFAQPKTLCAICGVSFDGDDEILFAHLHGTHSMPYSESCDCMVCFAQRLTEQSDARTEETGDVAPLEARTLKAPFVEPTDAMRMDIDDAFQTQDNLPPVDSARASSISEAELASPGNDQHGASHEYCSIGPSGEYDDEFYKFIEEMQVD